MLFYLYAILPLQNLTDVAVLHERLFRNALQLRLHKQKLKIYLTSFFSARQETAASQDFYPLPRSFKELKALKPL